MLHNFLNPFKQATAGLSEPQHKYFLLRGPSLGTSSSQPRFTAWLHQESLSPRTSSSHLRLLYGSGRVAPGKTQVGTDLGLHYLGNARACTYSEQLQTTPEHHHCAPAQMILHGGWMLVVSGHSQSLLLTDLGKSLSLTCQQQSRLNYKRRVYSAHTKDVPQVPSLGDGETVPVDPTGHLLH